MPRTSCSVVHTTNRLKHGFPGAVGRHQRIKRNLIDAEFVNKNIHITVKRCLGLVWKIKDHVNVERVEDALCMLQPMPNLITAPIFLEALHFLQELVVETLHSNG